MSRFSEFLKQKMEDKKINNKGLSILLAKHSQSGRFSPSTVGAWLDDEYPPKPENLMMLAVIFETDAINLFNMVYGLPLPDSEDSQLPPEIRDIVDELKNADVRVLRLIRDQIRMVLRPHIERMMAELGDKKSNGSKSESDSGDRQSPKIGSGI